MTFVNGCWRPRRYTFNYEGDRTRTLTRTTHISIFSPGTPPKAQQGNLILDKDWYCKTSTMCRTQPWQKLEYTAKKSNCTEFDSNNNVEEFKTKNGKTKNIIKVKVKPGSRVGTTIGVISKVVIQVQDHKHRYNHNKHNQQNHQQHEVEESDEEI
eukprot:Pgem_evm1s12091